jgi:hypothetical protein
MKKEKMVHLCLDSNPVSITFRLFFIVIIALSHPAVEIFLNL